MANPKAKRGHDAAGRPGFKQVVDGLLVGPEAFPISHEVFAATQDVTTLEAIFVLASGKGYVTRVLSTKRFWDRYREAGGKNHLEYPVGMIDWQRFAAAI